jgi:hypothetical protein
MRQLVTVLILFCGATAASAQVDISPIALVGKWTSQSKHPNGAIITSDVVLTQNMRFSGSSTVDGRPFLQTGGTWSVSGSTLTWRYESSSGLMPAPGTIDTDEIISVEASKLTLRSKLSGKQHEFVRSR